MANCSAVREWDSNGTNFGYRPELGHVAGEFGHNDFYAVPVAAAQVMGSMVRRHCGAWCCMTKSAGVWRKSSVSRPTRSTTWYTGLLPLPPCGAMSGASAEQIESAIGMVVAHFIPWRAIRAGKQLSDSKGASAAISTEVAITAMRRSMAGFLGPRTSSEIRSPCSGSLNPPTATVRLT